MAGKPDREQIRRDFPLCVAAADAFREVFGPEVKLLYAKEGGREIGKEREPGSPVPVGEMVLKPSKKKASPARPERQRWEESWEV